MAENRSSVCVYLLVPPAGMQDKVHVLFIRSKRDVRTLANYILLAC